MRTLMVILALSVSHVGLTVCQVMCDAPRHLHATHAASCHARVVVEAITAAPPLCHADGDQWLGISAPRPAVLDLASDRVEFAGAAATAWSALPFSRIVVAASPPLALPLRI